MTDKERVSVINFPFGAVKIRHGEVSPVQSVGRNIPLLIGQAYLEQFCEELWVRGFNLKEVVVSATVFCPECKRPL
jgi:hypothetical protein